jgi:hypothetical protein
MFKFAIAALAFCSFSAHALVYSVPAGDVGALRAAIIDANASPEPDIISLEKGLYSLRANFGARVALPVITSQIVLRGRGAELRAYSKNRMHLMEVARSGWLVLEGVTLAEGNDGALVNSGKADLHSVSIVDQTTRKAAAIISNFGELTMRGCDLSFNTISNARTDAGTIVNYGLVGIRNSRIRGNVVSRQHQTLALATVLLNFGDATLDQVNVSENEALSEIPTLRFSGNARGLMNRGAGKMRVTHLTQTGNRPEIIAPP